MEGSSSIGVESFMVWSDSSWKWLYSLTSCLFAKLILLGFNVNWVSSRITCVTFAQAKGCPRGDDRCTVAGGGVGTVATAAAYDTHSTSVVAVGYWELSTPMPTSASSIDGGHCWHQAAGGNECGWLGPGGSCGRDQAAARGRWERWWRASSSVRPSRQCIEGPMMDDSDLMITAHG
ncbi:hypothetical protein ACLOJK_029320 [Asimina triloba]